MDWKKLRDWLKNSGLLFAVVGAITSAAWKGLGLAWNWICSQFMTTVDVEKGSYLYEVLEEWLAAHPSAKKSTRFRAETIDREDEDDDDYSYEPCERNARKTDVSVVSMHPSQKLRCFLHDGHWIQVKYASDTIKTTSKNAEIKERIELSTFGRDRTIATKILQEAVNLYERSNQEAQRIYVSHSRDWNKIGRKRMRPAESVVLEGQLMEDIIADAKEFERDFETYQKLGIPHRRGYLLEGPPGTGKSSLIQVVSGKLERDIYYLKLAADDMSDDALEDLVNEVPHDAVLVIEDVDAAFHGRVNQQQQKSGGRYTGLTFSGLLNVLDGIAAGEGRLLFLTTNHIERLDPALIRPGRVDRIVSFGYATKTQIMRRYEAFFPMQPDAYGKELAAVVTPLNVTMAEVQQYLLLFRKDGELAYINRFRFRELTTNSAALFTDKFDKKAESLGSGEIVPPVSSDDLRIQQQMKDAENSMLCSRVEMGSSAPIVQSAGVARYRPKYRPRRGSGSNSCSDQESEPSPQKRRRRR